MNRHVKSLITAGFFVLAHFSVANACTTAIVSGKFTVDGRPLLLKHRDSDVLQNKMMFFSDGKYEYIGLVNTPDTAGNEIWAGSNSMGFAIMNSASYNLNLKDTASIKDQEGIIMKKALQGCATLEDFEEMLRSLPKPAGVEANFGVIDARGGAAYYEAGNSSFKKFDANDPSVAPFGYLIRTNYSFTGERAEDYGLIRYRTADELFYNASVTNSLSFEFIIKQVSRCLKHSLTKTDLTQNLPVSSETPSYVSFQDFIPRFSSSASVIVHGVKPGESPSFETIWTILGFQLCSVAVPMWVSGGSQIPAILAADKSGGAPLCRMALKLKEKCFPISRESGRSYLNLVAVINRENDGILQKILPLENDIIKETNQNMQLWREKGMNTGQIREFYKWLERTVTASYQKQFGF